jgi:sterol desaturase/sphingolipid hydroxylase (fatty acid hydroxylase superfamily)
MIKYKIQSDEIIKKGAVEWNIYAHSAYIALINQLWFLVFLILITPIIEYRGISYDQELPPWYIQLAQIPTFYFILSLIFYYVHRILHTPYLYKRIHKVHHSWQTPVGCSAIYAHPIEHLLNNILPVFIPTLILKMHPIYLNIIVFITTMNSVNVHSGYNFVNAQEHDDHHKYFLCNYGAGLDVFDWLHSTRYIDLDKHKQTKQQK